jgi:hypothetical protein
VIAALALLGIRTGRFGGFGFCETRQQSVTGPSSSAIMVDDENGKWVNKLLISAWFGPWIMVRGQNTSAV